MNQITRSEISKKWKEGATLEELAEYCGKTIGAMSVAMSNWRKIHGEESFPKRRKSGSKIINDL